MRAPVGALNVANQPIGIGRGLCAIRTTDVDPGFTWWWLHHVRPDLNSRATGSTFSAITSSTLGGLDVPEFDIARQHLIADYLDRETARVDTLIAKQEQLIATLRERRTALISEAVLADFRPFDTGSRAGAPLGALFSVVLGKMLDAGRAEAPDDVTLPYVRAANIQDDGLHLDDVNTMAFTPAEVERLSIQAGDLLVVEGGSIGTSALIPQDMDGWSFQKTVNRVRSTSRASTAWLGYVLRALRDSGVIAIICSGSTIAHFTAEKLRALRIPLRCAEEQRSTVTRLDDQTARIDDLIAKTERFIALARERRAALITAAVTGQIEVTAAA